MKFDINSVPLDLVSVKQQGPLKVLKYKNKVFYNNLWNKHPILKECRGLVLDEVNNVVAWPFTKVFNIGENGTEFPEFPFTLVEKVNGFLGVLSLYEGEYLFSTTGSTNSDFVQMWKEMFYAYQGMEYSQTKVKEILQNHTLMFEVCHPNDPHIVSQVTQVYLIGGRNNIDGTMLTEVELDNVAEYCGWIRPNYFIVTHQEELDYILDKCRIEGYMVRDSKANIVSKVKSKYYLGLKFMARCSPNKIKLLYNASTEQLFGMGLDEDFICLVESIRKLMTEKEWECLTEQTRLSLLRGLLHAIDLKKKIN